MSNRNFDAWLGTFRKSINGYDYYIDFEKVYANVDRLKIEINILNSLIGAKDIEGDFEKLLKKYPECLKVIPILLAVRNQEIYCQDENGAIDYLFGDRPEQSIEQYKYFMQKTGLFELLQNHIVRDLYDYITGVEVGLDSNGRKNRGGHQMEDLCESFIQKTGKRYGKEVYISEIETRTGLDLSALSNQGEATKRFDYVVFGDKETYGIECNFYTSGGSKLNETARSYKMIAEEATRIPGFTFVWLTDGEGWISARRNLKETFDVLETIYNIKDMENGELERVLK